MTMSQDNWKTIVSLFIILVGIFFNYRKTKKIKQEREFDPSVSNAEDLVSPFHWIFVFTSKYIHRSIVGVILIAYGVWLLLR